MSADVFDKKSRPAGKSGKAKKEYPKTDHRQGLIDRIVERMEGEVEYNKPWFPSGTGRPFNPVTGTIYRGVNALSLMVEGFDDPRFYTFNNILDMAKKAKAATPEGQEPPVIALRKGVHGVPIFKAVRIEVDAKNKDGDAAAATATTAVDAPTPGKRSFMVMKYAATVFNASQIEGLPALERKTIPEFEVNANIEHLSAAMQETGLTVIHENGKGASYSPSDDRVRLPEKVSFVSEAAYYRTKCHEFGHSTGHPSRLNRPLKPRRELEAYAYEELVAELTSYFMGAELGLPYDAAVHDNHAGYLKSWLGALKDDKELIFKAAREAGAATDYQLKALLAYKEAHGLSTQDDYAAQDNYEPEVFSVSGMQFADDVELELPDLDGTPVAIGPDMSLGDLELPVYEAPKAVASTAARMEG